MQCKTTYLQRQSCSISHAAFPNATITAWCLRNLIRHTQTHTTGCSAADHTLLLWLRLPAARSYKLYRSTAQQYTTAQRKLRRNIYRSIRCITKTMCCCNTQKTANQLQTRHMDVCAFTACYAVNLSPQTSRMDVNAVPPMWPIHIQTDKCNCNQCLPGCS